MFIFWWAALLPVLATSSPPTFLSPPHEFLALYSLFNATNGPTWRQQCRLNWNFSCLSEGGGAVCPDPCSGSKGFFGVTCHKGNVSSISLSRCHLSGTLPGEALNELVWLSSLDMQENNITGTVPTITKPLSLLTFQGAFNKFTGPVPPLHSSLYLFYFRGNYLTGEQPVRKNFIFQLINNLPFCPFYPPISQERSLILWETLAA